MRVVTTLEVGSITMKVNVSSLEDGRFRHISRGSVPTSVVRGDVKIGVDAATDEIRKTSGIKIDETWIFANGSATGGLETSVHGLIQGMTAHTTREAAFSMGVIVGLITVGAINSWDVEDLVEVSPNIVLFTGGVGYDEKRIAVDSARMIVKSGLRASVIYIENIAVWCRAQNVFTRNDVELMCTSNVPLDVGVLQIEPVRKPIHKVFNQHIVETPGTARLTELFGFEILPTPGVVLLAAEIFAGAFGDALVIDIGGVTTDIHSAIDGSAEQISHSIDSELRAKRIVEGDLGVSINACQVVVMSGETGDEERLEYLRAISPDEKEEDATCWLTTRAVEVGICRHAGSVSSLPIPTGKKQIVRGKGLTATRWIIGTGGVLIRIPDGDEIPGRIRLDAGARLLPPPETRISIDRSYRFSALGALAQVYHEGVTATFRGWVADEMGELPEPIEDETPEG